MKILVLSDSHGDKASIRMAVTSNNPDAVIFLGDGLRDWEECLPYIKCGRTVAVRGNCDLYANDYPTLAIETLQGHILYCTHGHSEMVKYGLGALIERAGNENASIALFGHTHDPYTSYEDGLYLMNPGSARLGSCGIIEITRQGIFCFTKKIVT